MRKYWAARKKQKRETSKGSLAYARKRRPLERVDRLRPTRRTEEPHPLEDICWVPPFEATLAKK
jgi:hypothetical protein